MGVDGSRMHGKGCTTYDQGRGRWLMCNKIMKALINEASGTNIYVSYDIEQSCVWYDWRVKNQTKSTRQLTINLYNKMMQIHVHGCRVCTEGTTTIYQP